MVKVVIVPVPAIFVWDPTSKGAGAALQAHHLRCLSLRRAALAMLEAGGAELHEVQRRVPSLLGAPPGASTATKQLQQQPQQLQQQRHKKAAPTTASASRPQARPTAGAGPGSAECSPASTWQLVGSGGRAPQVRPAGAAG